MRAHISSLKQQHSDEQLRLGNEHINELARVRRELEEQRRADVDAASSDTRLDTIKEEFRRERDAMEARYREEIETLKNASEHWEEQLRTGYQEQEARHAAEIESSRAKSEERERDLERSLREDFERRLAEDRSEAEDRHRAAVQTLRNAAATRELELQRDYQTVVERQQGEIDPARRTGVIPPEPGGVAQGGAARDQGADGETRARPQKDARGQARRGAGVVGQEGRVHPGPEGGGQQGAQGAPRRGDRRYGARPKGDSRPRTSAGRPRPGRSTSVCGRPISGARPSCAPTRSA